MKKMVKQIEEKSSIFNTLYNSYYDSVQLLISKSPLGTPDEANSFLLKMVEIISGQDLKNAFLKDKKTSIKCLAIEKSTFPVDVFIDSEYQFSIPASPCTLR